MADNTPVTNVLNIKIANYLDDPIPAQADNGQTAAYTTSEFSATQRNQALNESLAWVVHELVKRVGVEGAALALPGAVATQAITNFSSSGVTVNKDFMYPIRLISSTNPPFQLRPRSDLSQDQDYQVNYAYAIDGGKLYAYIRAAGTLTIQNSGAATLYYLKADRKNTTSAADTAVNTAPDTTLDYRFLDAATWYACHLLAHAKGAAEWIVKSQRFLELALEKFPKI